MKFSLDNSSRLVVINILEEAQPPEISLLESGDLVVLTHTPLVQKTDLLKLFCQPQDSF